MTNFKQIYIIIIFIGNKDCHRIYSRIASTNMSLFPANCCKKNLEYIFGENNYKLIKKVYFNSNDESFPALFFHFKLTKNTILIDDRNINNNRHLYMQQLLKTFKVTNNTYIATAGSISICIYNLIENKENIIGIIDKNNLMHGKKFGNSELIVQSYEYLKEIKNANIIVCHYRKNDIIKCIRKYNTDINIIEL